MLPISRTVLGPTWNGSDDIVSNATGCQYSLAVLFAEHAQLWTHTMIAHGASTSSSNGLRLLTLSSLICWTGAQLQAHSFSDDNAVCVHWCLHISLSSSLHVCTKYKRFWGCLSDTRLIILWATHLLSTCPHLQRTIPNTHDQPPRMHLLPKSSITWLSR